MIHNYLKDGSLLRWASGKPKERRIKKKKSENLAKALFDYFLDEPDQKN